MTDWGDLNRELDAWAAAGQSATLWWRDDDAVEPSPALERLLGLAGRHGVPLALAVIPARAACALAGRLATAGPGVVPVQHGFAHRNHAPHPAKKAELGDHRPPGAVLEELARGRAAMSALFGSSWLAVLVPPWNRIAPGVLGRLTGLGFVGVSTYGARGALHPAPGLVQVNSHVDLMRWPPPRGFVGEPAALELLVDHLRARRQGQVDGAEPTGLLSHHPAHDDAAWDFLDRLVGHLTAHPAVRFMAPGEAFAGPPAPAQRGAA